MKFPSFSLVLLLAHVTIADLPPPGKCYWPNGDKAPENYIQCPGRKNCCASGESCLTNNLCYAAHLNVAYRGACADKTWPLSGCPRVCYTEVQNAWANLYSCTNKTNQQFTCGAPNQWVTEVCDNDLGIYDWNADSNFAVANAAVSANSSSSSASATPTQSASNSLGSETAACTPTGENESSHKNVALAAGLGAGLGVPLLLVSIGFLLYWMRTKTQLQEARAQAQQYANALHQGKSGMLSVPAELSPAENSIKELANSEVRRELEG